MGPRIAAPAGGPPFTIRLLNASGEFRNQLQIDGRDLSVGSSDHIAYYAPATEAQAKALSQVLKSIAILTDSGTTVGLWSTGATMAVSFSMKDGAAKDDRVLAWLQTVGRKIAPAVGGLPIEIHVLDTSYVERKVVTIQ
jgi:hypothetical protein